MHIFLDIFLLPYFSYGIISSGQILLILTEYLFRNTADIQAITNCDKRYLQDMASLCGSKNRVALWIERGNDELLGNKTSFMPFPEDLIEPDPEETDRGCDVWKE